MVLCEGGETISENNYIIHYFKTVGNSTLKVINGGFVEVLVVAGGGGGGNGNGTTQEAGGGGAGGLIYMNELYLTRQTDISITVGAGGVAATNGGNSIFKDLTANGGGSGGSGGIQAGIGGSGGGGSYEKTGSIGTTGQGNSGGSGTLSLGLISSFAACGGGGGGAGYIGNTNYLSFGGDGLYYPQFSNIGGSPPGWFAGGGQGGTVGYYNKKYRSYGGGGYSSDIIDSEPYPGIPNTGGGGGGRVQTSGSGEIGGSGIVIIRYKNYISNTTSISFSDIRLEFGGIKPLYLSKYYADNVANYTTNLTPNLITNLTPNLIINLTPNLTNTGNLFSSLSQVTYTGIPNTGNPISLSQLRNYNDNSINFNTYTYYNNFFASNCISMAIDQESNIYFTDNTTYISKINSNKILNSTFYNLGVTNCRIYILNNILYLAYRFLDTTSTPVYLNGTKMQNYYIRLSKLTLTNGSVSTDVLFADKLHHYYLQNGDQSFFPSENPGPIIVNPNGDVYIGITYNYSWKQQDIIKIASDGTKSIIFQYTQNAVSANKIIYSLAPSYNSVGFYTIQSNKFNYMIDTGTITTLYTLQNSNYQIVSYLNSRMIIYDTIYNIIMIYDFNSSTIIETVSFYNVSFLAMCRSNINDVYFYNYNYNRILIRKCPNDGSSKKRAALSGLHLAQLNTKLNLQLANGYYWIKSEQMPNALQMYVNFTADGGGYDFYVMTTATSTNYMYQRTGAEKLGLDIFYPRSKEHWVAIYNFVVNISGSTIATLVPIPGKIYRISLLGIGNYTGVLMRDPRFYSSGAPDWMVPDGGKWFIRDTTYSEPNGNYTLYAHLYTWFNRLLSDGTVEFDDFDSNGSTGTTILCSTNFKGSLYDISTNDGSTSIKAALSGWHLAKYSKTYNLNLPSGTYWIQTPKMPNALQMYVDMTREEGGYDFYRLTTATSCNYVTDNTGASVLGLDIFYPRSKEHWAAIYNFVVNISGSTIADDVKTVGAVHRVGVGNLGGSYTSYVMRDPRYYITGAPNWRVPDDGKWFIRDTTYSEPNGGYTGNAFICLTGLQSDGSVTAFNDEYNTYNTGTTIICSTNIKGYSHYN